MNRQQTPIADLPAGTRLRRGDRELLVLQRLPELPRTVLAADDRGILYSLDPEDTRYEAVTWEGGHLSVG